MATSVNEVDKDKIKIQQQKRSQNKTFIQI